MGPQQYIVLAKAIGEEIKKGLDGIIIGHGTDTMHHTASALAFMVQNTPIPIVIVGSQRSSDRPSSDAALNLIHATTAAANSDIAEVMVCTTAIRAIIRDDKIHQIYGLMQAGQKYGMQTMNQGLFNAHMHREISLDEAMRRSHDTQELGQMLGERVGV